MKKLIVLNFVFLLCFCNYLFLIPFNLNQINVNNQDKFKVKLNSPGKSLLHKYDFEDDIVGQNPTGITLSVNDPLDSGTARIDNLGDDQQNHLALNKSGGSKSIRLEDNFSYYGYDYEAGELHFKFYHDNSLYGIHMRDSAGTLFAVDLWNGNVGRYPSTTYTSYTLNTWTNFTFFYNISLGWMFEIDGTRFGDGYSYSFEHGSPTGIEEVHWGSAYSGGGDGFLRIDDIAFYYENENFISIYTPESRDYEKTMDGYYPATYGFEDVLNNSLPNYCYYTAWGTVPDYTNSYTKVIDEKTDGAGNRHNRVLVLNDRSSSGCCGSHLNFTNYGSEVARDCTIEFYFCIRTEGSSYYISQLELHGNNGRLLTIALDNTGGGLSNPEIRYWNATGNYHAGVYQEWDRWYRYSIDISCGGGYAGLGPSQYRFRIYNDTGDLIYNSIDMGFENSYPLTGGPNRFRMSSSQTQTLVYEYLDAFSVTGLQMLLVQVL